MNTSDMEFIVTLLIESYPFGRKFIDLRVPHSFESFEM